jgi:hypothetical protein
MIPCSTCNRPLRSTEFWDIEAYHIFHKIGSQMAVRLLDLAVVGNTSPRPLQRQCGWQERSIEWKGWSHGCRTGRLPACSTVSQTTALHRAFCIKLTELKQESISWKANFCFHSAKQECTFSGMRTLTAPFTTTRRWSFLWPRWVHHAYSQLTYIHFNIFISQLYLS